MSAASPLVMAIDLGTGSCRAALFDESGSQVAIGQREYAHAPAPGVPGSQVFDTTAVWSLVVQCIRDALAAAGRPAAAVAAVAATSMREGMVLYDSGGTELWACPNVDSRASEEATELVRSGAARRIFDLAGDWVAITAPARFRWIASHEPEILAATAHVGMLGDWVATKLTGEFTTDPSLGSSSGLFDLGKRSWSEEILDLCGLDASVFPPVLEPGTVLGAVTTRSAEETGLDVGTPVVVGGADTQLALAALGVHRPGRFTIVGGSFWQQTLVADEPLIDPAGRLRTLCHTVPERWMVEGIGFYSGMVMRWFRDGFCELEKEEARRHGLDPYELLEEKARLVPLGSGGLVGIFSDVMQANRWRHASPSFIGFDVASPARSGRMACYRAIEESAAYVSLGHLRILQELTRRQIDEAIFTGGAAKGSLWPQIVADVLGVAVHIPVVKESTALGAALYAGVGAGLWEDACGKAERVVRFDRTFEPSAAAHEQYLELFERWTQVYRHELELVDSGLVNPLWRAAGA